MIPKVSIIVPCYNQAQYLDEALQSVLEQTYQNWECIIINDGSPDNTEEVVKKWLEKDSRFKYVLKENGGLSSARNAGLDMATGDYIQFLDSDDVLAENKLQLSLEQLILNQTSGVEVVITNFRKFTTSINSSTNPYCNLNPAQFNFESLLYQWGETFTIPIHCGLFKGNLFQQFRFPEHLRAKEDWVMWVSIFQFNCKAVFIDEPLVFYRMNPSSMTMTKDMLPDFIKAFEYLKTILTEKQYQKLSLVLITRYFNSSSEVKKRIRLTKASNTYQTGLLIKKIVKAVGLLPLCRKIFPLILKLKSK